MKHAARLGRCSLLVLAASWACGVDERPLTFEYHALDAAGSTASPGRGGESGSSNAGASGVDDGRGGAPNAGACSNCAGVDDAGAPSDRGDAGDASSSAAGASGGGASGSSSAGGGGAGRSPMAGAAGHAGAGPEFPCGDLNQDAVDDCEQTLVQNSRFDTAVNGWNTEPSTSQLWDASNASGKPGSGSLQVESALPVAQAIGDTVAGSRQCIPVTPTTNYDFSARVMLAPAQAAGQAGINVWLFDDDSCQGNLVTGNTPIAGGEAGKWTTLNGKLWIPGGVQSMYVRLVAIKPFAQASLTVLIDDVLVAKR